MEILAIVTALALLEYLGISLLVGRARGKYGIKAPATSGHEIFERTFRVHQNTLEQLMRLPAVALDLRHVREPDVGRAARTRVHRRPRDLRARLRRGAGAARHGLPGRLVANLVLLLGGLIGAVLRLFRAREPARRARRPSPSRQTASKRGGDARAGVADAGARRSTRLAGLRPARRRGPRSRRRARASRPRGPRASARTPRPDAERRSRRAASTPRAVRTVARSIAGTAGSASPASCSPRSSSAPAARKSTSIMPPRPVFSASFFASSTPRSRVDAAAHVGDVGPGVRRLADDPLARRARAPALRALDVARHRARAQQRQVLPGRGLLGLVARERLVRGDQRALLARRPQARVDLVGVARAGHRASGS